MIEFPKWLNTPFDVEYCLKEFPDQMQQKLKEFAADRFYWQGEEMAAKQAGIEDATHKVEQTADGSKVQLQLVEKPSSHLSRLKLTIADVDNIVKIESEHAVEEKME
jgi:hypothetical protein